MLVSRVNCFNCLAGMHKTVLLGSLPMLKLCDQIGISSPQFVVKPEGVSNVFLMYF